jgi:hypothetical protein
LTVPASGAFHSSTRTNPGQGSRELFDLLVEPVEVVVVDTWLEDELATDQRVLLVVMGIVTL